MVVEFMGGNASELATLSLVSPAAEIPQSGCETKAEDMLPGNVPFRPLLNNQATQAGCRVILDADAGDSRPPRLCRRHGLRLCPVCTE